MGFLRCVRPSIPELIIFLGSFHQSHSLVYNCQAYRYRPDSKVYLSTDLRNAFTEVSSELLPFLSWMLTSHFLAFANLVIMSHSGRPFYEENFPNPRFRR